MLIAAAPPQELGEQRMIAVPAALIVETADEKSGLLDVVEHLPGIFAARHCIAKRCTKSLEHRGLQQKITDLRGQRREDLFGEEIRQGPGPSSYRRQHVCWRGSLPQYAARELECRDPTLHARLYHREVRCRQFAIA